LMSLQNPAQPWKAKLL